MSARANAPVFQLHPSATSISSPPTSLVAPAPIPGPIIPGPHGFTPANAPPPQLVSHQTPLPHSQQHPPQAPPPQQVSGPTHHQTYHQRTESGPGHHRRRSSSFSRRRADARSRSSVPPQLGPTLPQINPRSEADLISGARTAPAPTSSYIHMKREDEIDQLGEHFGKRKRDEELGLRADGETRSLGARSPDRSSQRSGTGSVKSLKRGDPNES